MKYPSLVVLFLAGALATLCQYSHALADEPNSLSEDERKSGFELLFNGKDFSGWEQGGNWIVEDGLITRKSKGSKLTYKVKPVPDDFELRFQWKVAKGSNSGIYYRPGQYEYQVLDNDAHADGKNPRTSAASLYFCMAPSKDQTRPVGEWNEGRVICKGTIVQHWLNGEKVLDFDYTDPKWAWNVELLKQRGGQMTARGGELWIQDHGDPVWYRGIKMRAIPADEELDSTPVTPAKIPQDILDAEKEKLDRIIESRTKRSGKNQ